MRAALSGQWLLQIRNGLQHALWNPASALDGPDYNHHTTITAADRVLWRNRLQFPAEIGALPPYFGCGWK